VPHTPGERRVIALVSPILALLCGGGLISLHAIRRHSNDDWRNQVLDLLIFGTFDAMIVSTLLVSLLLFVSATIRPRWSIAAAEWAVRHFVHAMIVVLVCFALSIPIGYWLFA
jgi:uncharacterized membrane protein